MYQLSIIRHIVLYLDKEKIHFKGDSLCFVSDLTCSTDVAAATVAAAADAETAAVKKRPH